MENKENKSMSKQLLEVFITDPIKDSGNFFKDVFNTFKILIKLFISPEKVLEDQNLNVEDFKHSRILFKFIFFALVIKIAFNEMSGISSLTVVEQITNQLLFLVIYLIGLFFSVFTAFVWGKINSLNEKQKIGTKLFISIFNIIIIFSLVVFILQIKIEPAINWIVIFSLTFIILLRVKKFFDNKTGKNIISGFIVAFLLSVYFFIMFFMLDAVWNMNTNNANNSTNSTTTGIIDNYKSPVVKILS